MIDVSFCHPGTPKTASYRYRCAIPAAELGAKINDPCAAVLIGCKPNEQDIPYTLKAKAEGRAVVMDFCDMHFEMPFYVDLLRLADCVTCASDWMAAYLREEYGVDSLAIYDPYEFEEREPHCAGARLLWYGHPLNAYSLFNIASQLVGYEISMVSGFEGSIPWSLEALQAEFAKADIVVMPETAPYKSANRTVEAIRQGCFVVAEPHPAISDIPGIWIGNIKKGIEWAQHNQSEANARTKQAQSFIEKRYSPRTVASAWRTAIQRARDSCISVAALRDGTDG